MAQMRVTDLTSATMAIISSAIKQEPLKLKALKVIKKMENGTSPRAKLDLHCSGIDCLCYIHS